METCYKLRAVPISLGLLTLAAGLAMRFFLPAVAGTDTIKFGVLLTVGGVIFFRTMGQLKSERQGQTYQPELVSAATVEELERENQIYQRKNSIPFLAVRVFLCLLFALLGIVLLVEGNLLGGAGLLLGGGLCMLHVYWIVRCCKELRLLERAEKK